MRISENRVIASAALVLSIVISVVGLGGSALKRDQKRILSVFNEGTDPSLSVRHSIDAYMEQCSESAINIALEGESINIDPALTDAVRQLAEQVTDGNNTFARFEALEDLRDKVDKLDNAIYGSVSADDYTDCKLAYSNFKSYSDMIQRDGYNDEARAYNKFLDGFPASLVSGLVGAGEMGSYGG